MAWDLQFAHSDEHTDAEVAPPARPMPGKVTRTERLRPGRRERPAATAAPVQADRGGFVVDDPFALHRIAQRGVAGSAQTLPHLATIQAAFGHHDVTGVRAHVGGAAATAARDLGAGAYATGDDVAFVGAPDLRQAAHEAAHVVQQRGGVRLDGGFGRAGDAYEAHADAVADRVVRGESAEALLDTMAHRGASGGPAVQFWDGPDAAASAAAPVVEGDAAAPVMVLGTDWLVANGVARDYRGRLTMATHRQVMTAVARALAPLYPRVPVEQIATGLFVEVDEETWRQPVLRMRAGAQSVERLRMLDEGTRLRVMRVSGGLVVLANTAAAYHPGGMGAELDRLDLARSVLDTLEEEIGHEMLADPREAERQRLIAGLPDRGGDIVNCDYPRARLVELFGRTVVSDFLAREASTEAETIDTADGPREVPAGTTTDARTAAAEMLRAIFGPPPPGPPPSDRPPTRLTSAEIAALAALAAEPEDRRAAILEELREMRGGSGGATRDPTLDNYIAAARAEVERRTAAADLGVEVPDGADPEDGPLRSDVETTTPLFAHPVEGEIHVMHEVNAGMDAAFRFEQANRDVVDDVPHVDITWYLVEVLPNHDHRHLATERQRFTTPSEPPTWAPTIERRGDYEVHAFVNHSFYMPAHFSQPLHVPDSAERLAAAHAASAGGFGERRGDPTPYEFDAVVGSDDDRLGAIETGALYRGVASSDTWTTGLAETGRIDQELEQLQQALDAVGGDTTTRDAIRGRIERLRAYRARLERMSEDETYHPVETQTHYATRTEGVASGELRVLVEFTTVGEGERLRWRGRLYDESELVNGEMRFEQEADSYEAMMEALFVELSRSYPAGDMSFGYQIWDEHVRPTRQFRRLSRSTESTLSRANETVFSPEAQIAVNIATMLLALFPPTSGIGIGLGFAYNAAATGIDESERWRVGRGDATRTTLQLGLLMCDLLPGVGRGGRALVIAGHAATLVEHGVNAYIFYDDYRDQLVRLRDGQVTELARVHAELAERRSMNPNDPELPRLETELRRLQTQVQDAAEELFTTMAGQQALMMAVAHGAEAVGSHGEAPHLPPGDDGTVAPHRRIEGADGDSEGGTVRRRTESDDEGGTARRRGEDEDGEARTRRDSDAPDREPRAHDDEARPRESDAPATHRDGDEATTRRGDAAGDEDLPHVPMDAEGAVARELDPVDAARRLGVTLFEVDARLGRDVEVDYAIAANGEIAVVGVRAGPDASAADILAHREVVRSLERYNGTFGRFRAMWDGIQRRFGHVAEGSVPAELRPGTVGYDAYLEVQKLERIVRQRRAALGLVEGGRGHLSEADATRLTDDIAFLDDEIERYIGILETGGGAASDGVVRSRMPGDDAAVVAAGYPDPGEDYWFINSPAAVRDTMPFQIQRREGARSDVPVLRAVPHGSVPADQVVHAGTHFDLVAGTPSRAERAAAILAGFPVRARERFAALQTRFEALGAQVVPLVGVATTDVQFSELRHPRYSNVLRRIETIIFNALPSSLSASERRSRARAAVEELGRHTITVVRGTDQLRAHNYRLAYGEADGDLHHLIPLYLGGEHTHLIDMDPAYHDQLHELIDGIQFDADTTLAPHSIQAADLNFREGAAVLHDSGRVTLYRWNGSTLVEIPRSGGGS